MLIELLKLRKSKRNLNHCVGLLMVNEVGVTCCLGIFDTPDEKSITVAELIFEKIKDFSNGSDGWRNICGKVRGFMGDQAHQAQKLNRELANMCNDVVPGTRSHLTCFLHYT